MSQHLGAVRTTAGKKDQVAQIEVIGGEGGVIRAMPERKVFSINFFPYAFFLGNFLGKYTYNVGPK